MIIIITKSCRKSRRLYECLESKISLKANVCEVSHNGMIIEEVLQGSAKI